MEEQRVHPQEEFHKLPWEQMDPEGHNWMGPCLGGYGLTSEQMHLDLVQEDFSMDIWVFPPALSQAFHWVKERGKAEGREQGQEALLEEIRIYAEGARAQRGKTEQIRVAQATEAPSLYQVLSKMAIKQGVSITECIRGAVALQQVVEDALDQGKRVAVQMKGDRREITILREPLPKGGG